MSIQVMNKQEEDKFLSKLLSKEEDRVRSSSSRVYYCGGASVPFKWESRPGTPKRALFSESSRPALPLTPPPSYYSTNKDTIMKRIDSKQNQHSLLDALNLRNTKKQNQKNRKFSYSFSWSPTTSHSLSSSSSSFSLSPISRNTATRTRMYYEEDETGENSPKTPFCFGSRRRDSKKGSGYSMVRVKKALFSVIGHECGS